MCEAELSKAIVAGALAGSRALRADALDFLGEGGNCAISLGIARMDLAWRARTALAKGIAIYTFGLAVLAAAIWGIAKGASPERWAMTGSAHLRWPSFSR